MTTPTRAARTAPQPPQGGGPTWDWAAPPPSSHTARAAERPQEPAPSPAGGLSRGRRLWSLLPVTGMTAASGYGFHRIFELHDLLPVFLVAVLAPVALSTVLSGLLFARKARPNRPTALWPSVLLTGVGWLVTAAATLFHQTGGGLPTPHALHAVWAALLDSPHAVLSTILPAPGDPELLVLPHAVLWLAAFASTELALRTRNSLLPAVPPVLAFGAPLVLGVDGTGSDTPVPAALAALAAVLLLIRSGARFSIRGLAFGLPTTAVLALVAGLLGPHLPGLGAPYDPRAAVTPHIVHPESTSPLDQVAAWMHNGDEKVFTVKATSAQNYRLAVLDAYDGTTWSSTAELTRTGGRVPAEKGTDPGRTKRLTQRFSVQRLPGIWLPAADRPSFVTAPAHTDMAVDPDSAVLSTGRDIPSAFSYTVTSELPVYDADHLQYAAAADDPKLVSLPRTDVAGQRIPSVDSFAKVAAKATAGSTYPYQQAVRLADWLRRGYAFDPTAIPGHTYRGLEFFLTDSRRGTSEQFAAAFAVMARTLGLPTRVVVGFRPGTRTSADTWQITGKDVLAWPEVEFRGIGWVPFYPTPGEASKNRASVAPAGEPKDRKAVDKKITEEPRPDTAPKNNGRGGTAVRATGTGGLPLWFYVLVVGLALVTAYLSYAAWAPYRRRARRRKHPDPARRVLGAWQQIVDRLTELGLPATGAHTAEEVAAFGADRLGDGVGSHLPTLAMLVNEVGYGGRTPDAASADAAWAHCDSVEKIVLRSVPRRERLRRTLHPGALLRR
ncbi:DUF3488 and transglutaminase-like domain-containing protein [Streptomyces sp. NPDC096012]|uniref:DUF3488 and transglutaminase-like domain-containing protein n=1 Tax=Streptomyces sp. NPDC096012 TaxID=3155684 RepID=UPI003369D2DA